MAVNSWVYDRKLNELRSQNRKLKKGVLLNPKPNSFVLQHLDAILGAYNTCLKCLTCLRMY